MKIKRKNLTKDRRLQSAESWIKDYKGKSIISGYAKWFGVDKVCAIKELKRLGVVIPESLENQIIASLKTKQEQKLKQKQENEKQSTFLVESDSDFGFIAGYTSGGIPYGLTHDDMAQIEIKEDENTPSEENQVAFRNNSLLFDFEEKKTTLSFDRLCWFFGLKVQFYKRTNRKNSLTSRRSSY